MCQIQQSLDFENVVENFFADLTRLIMINGYTFNVESSSHVLDALGTCFQDVVTLLCRDCE